MPRRVGLPGASELFRSTSTELGREAQAARTANPDAPPRRSPQASGPAASAGAASGDRTTPTGKKAREVQHTGRIRHDEKITVYVSAEELLALEHLRLELRAEHGLAVDRGRIVRAAIASALAAIDEQGSDADVVRRLADGS